MSNKKNASVKKIQTHTGLNINAISFVSFLMFTIVLTAGLYIGQQDPLYTLANQRQTVANSIIKNTALKFTSQVETYSSVLQGLARDPALINIFSTKYDLLKKVFAR